MQEVKDLTSLKLKELLGSLMIHELTLNQQEEEKVRKKKSIALAAKIQEESEESSNENKSESKVSLLARKIRNFIRKKKSIPRNRAIDKGELEKVICYECKKSRHLRSECSNLRKEFKKKKKAFVGHGAIARNLHLRMNIKNAPTYV